MPSFLRKIGQITTILIFCLFGSQIFAKSESSDRFGVIGVIAQKSSPQSKQSLAVIRDVQTNRNLVVRVGDQMPGGFVVKSIRQGEVKISSGDQEFILSPNSFDGVSAVAANEPSRDRVEFDDSDIEDEFIEPPPPGAPPGTPGEPYTMYPGEIREPPPSTARNANEFPTTRRPGGLPPPPPLTQDGFGRASGDLSEPPMPPSAPPMRESEFDNTFSGYEELFDGP